MKAIKEFLKPNWWKVIIFILIAVLAILSITSTALATPPCSLERPCPLGSGKYVITPLSFTGLIVFYWPTAPIVWLLSSLGSADSSIELIMRALLLILGIAITLFYWYLLACLIYFVFTKVKRMISKKPQPEEE